MTDSPQDGEKVEQALERVKADLADALEWDANVFAIDVDDAKALLSAYAQLEARVREESSRADRFAELEAETNNKLVNAHARVRALEEDAQAILDGVREELHQRRVADWHPEGANSAALQMSEDMRLIGNRLAEIDLRRAATLTLEQGNG